jgi:excisionase family DNA binding protein
MRYYNAVEAARELNISDKTIRRWVKKGKIPAKRTQFNEIAIPESEIDRLRLELGSSDKWVDSPLSAASTPNQDRVDTPVEHDLEQRLASLAQSIANLNAAVASQTRRIDELSARVAELEAKQSLVPLTELPHTPLYRFSVDREDSPTSQPQIRTTQPPVDIPPGSMLFADFAAQHGVNRSSFHRHCTSGIKGDRVKTIEKPKGGRIDHTERWLSPEQQGAAIAFWQRHNVRYTE